MSGAKKLTLQEKKRLIDFLDEHKHLSQRKLSKIATLKFQKYISRHLIRDLVKSRSLILSGPDHGHRIRLDIEQKFENELISEIARTATQLPGDTTFSWELAQNLAKRLKSKPEYENSMFKTYTFSNMWWSNFRKRHGWDSRTVGLRLTASQVETAFPVHTGLEDIEIQEITEEYENNSDDVQIPVRIAKIIIFGSIRTIGGNFGHPSVRPFLYFDPPTLLRHVLLDQ